MKIKFILLCCIVSMFSTSCDNEIDINAPWIETPVIYGLLDAGFDEQFIRIQKTYQNDVNNPTSAQISDSLYFDSLDVRVISSLGETFIFIKDTSITKEPGFFATNNHTVYKCVGFRPVLNRNYQLVVRNLISGKAYRANDTIVEPARLERSQQIIFKYNNASDTSTSLRVTNIRVGENSRINDAGIRLHYLEIPNSNPSASSEKYVDHKFFTSREDVAPRPSVNLSDKVFRIMNTYDELLPRDPNITRRLIKMEVFWLAGGEDLKLIIELSQPSQFLVQRKPEFSNIDNGGLGIFTSRASAFFPIQYSDTTAQNISERLGFQYP